MTLIPSVIAGQVPFSDQAKQPGSSHIILGIETSCDETAVALVRGDGQILAHQLISQIDDHQIYGGVVPEIAARQHILHLDKLISRALKEADLELSAVSAVAATTGPGLIGGLMVGVMTAKAMALATGKPFIAVNHLEGHALTVRLSHGISFPFLLLLVSGGHCQILSVEGVGRYKRLGTTIDDAVGEAFDKTAKLLGLSYPGGPALEKLALEGDQKRFNLPRPMRGIEGCNFSFSGLKTAVRRSAEMILAEKGSLSRQDRADLAASFQAAIADCLCDRLKRAILLFKEAQKGDKNQRYPLVVAGGVAANQFLRRQLEALAQAESMDFTAPPLPLCTDNGVMIAWAGLEHYRLDPERDDQLLPARPRWPLDKTAEALIGSGKKGAKA